MDLWMWQRRTETLLSTDHFPLRGLILCMLLLPPYEDSAIEDPEQRTFGSHLFWSDVPIPTLCPSVWKFRSKCRSVLSVICCGQLLPQELRQCSPPFPLRILWLVCSDKPLSQKDCTRLNFFLICRFIILLNFVIQCETISLRNANSWMSW